MKSHKYKSLLNTIILSASLAFSSYVFPNSDSCVADAEKFLKECNLNSLGCASQGPGAMSRCQQMCNQKYMEFKMECRSNSKGSQDNQPRLNMKDCIRINDAIYCKIN